MKRVIVLVAAGLTLAAPPARAQHEGHSGRGDRAAMMARMDSMDARLDSLAGLMNRAKGTARVDAMAGILNMLVSHQREMRREMHRGMMEPGMQRDCGMQRGAMPDSGRAGGGPHHH
jgi:hypothetical protein